ncbi:nucleolar protein 56 isoform X2 [Macrobrachium rosenbergii]|uniref:nucleolar protein 56 isoform X2 n=1 Tax=Macrobrachium rosenbergii TaxID=79674 RepID=UPI0034D67912
MAQLYILFEHASGFGLFRVTEFEEVGAFLPQVEEAVNDSSKFHSIVRLVGFKPFTSAASALENINAISEGILTSELSAFLETNLPAVGKNSKVLLGVADVKLAAAINEALSLSVTHVGVVPEIIRGIRQHLSSYVKGLSPASMRQTELGLGHSYSRGKVKFNVNRADNMIIQSINILDQLDKDINTFAMRMKEWYSYHFPELGKIVTDNYQYSLCADAIKDRKTLSEASLEKLEEIVMDPAKAQAILDASRMSMGMDISPIDLMNIERFAKRVISLSAYRKQLAEYLKNKMSMVAPNLAVLIGEVVGARLISHSGSLTNLAKYPASTVQILGAEKALFRAIKTRSNTPKYGLIYHASFIARAGLANKGRISRYLANKCSIASRIDCFSEHLTSVYGEKLKEQVEERLKFYESGDIPRKNVEVMAEALSEHNEALSRAQLNAKKRKREEMANGDEEGLGEGESEESPKKKKKKKKKKKAGDEEGANAVEDVATAEAVVAEEPEDLNGTTEESVKKKKKKKKSLQPDEGQDVNGSQEQETAEEPVPADGEDAPKKKKKKKKSLLPDEVNLNGSQEQEPVEEPAQVDDEGTTPKKKKKKKSLPLEEEAMETSFTVNGGEAADQQESPKKKKKKKNREGSIGAVP